MIDAHRFSTPDADAFSPLAPDAAAEEPEEDFAAMLEASFQQLKKRYSEGDSVKGKVVKVDGKLAFIELGGKSEGLIDTHEFLDPDGNISIQVGQEIEARVIGHAADDGSIRLSKALARGAHSKEQLYQAFANRLAVEGKVTGMNKGGYEVQVAGMPAFVPFSQIDRYRSPSPEAHINQTYMFRILEFKGGGRSITLSRALLLAEEAAEKRASLLATLKEGDVVAGKVRAIMPFGAFVDLGGLDGLIPISELAWHRVKDVREILNEGDAVTVSVKKFDKDRERLSLSLKALASNPWDDVGLRFSEGGIYAGKVVRLEAFGAFVELTPGLEGLLHISNMAWDRRIVHPKDVVKEGDLVTVQLLSIDLDKRRLGLGMKQVGGDPWEGVLERFAPGSLVHGTVEKVASFGVFVTLEPGVTALLPNSESNTARGSELGRTFPLGQVIQARVLDVNLEERRLTLSRKNLEEDADKAAFAQYQAQQQAPKDAAGASGSSAGVGSRSGSLGTLGAAKGLSELLAKVKVKPNVAPAVITPAATASSVSASSVSASSVSAPAAPAKPVTSAAPAVAAPVTARSVGSQASAAPSSAAQASAAQAVVAPAPETAPVASPEAPVSAPVSAPAAPPREARRILVRR